MLFGGEKLAINEKNPLFVKNSNYNKQNFKVLTYQELSTLQKPNPSFGSILLADYVPYKDSYVVSYVTVNPEKPAFVIVSYPESSILNEEGNWYIDLSNIRRIGTGELLKIKNKDQYYQFLEVYGREGLVYSTIVPLSQNAPAEPIKLAIYSNNKLKDSVKAQLHQEINTMYANLGIKTLSKHIIPKVSAYLIEDPGNPGNNNSSSSNTPTNPGNTNNNNNQEQSEENCKTHRLIRVRETTVSRKNEDGCQEECKQKKYIYEEDKCTHATKEKRATPHSCSLVNEMECLKKSLTPTPTKKVAQTATPTPKPTKKHTPSPTPTSQDAMSRSECNSICHSDPSAYGASTVGACVSKCMGSTNSTGSESSSSTTNNNQNQQTGAYDDQCKLECSDPAVPDYGQCYSLCKKAQDPANTPQEPSSDDNCPSGTDIILVYAT